MNSNHDEMYFIMECRTPDMMLLFPPQDPSFEDNWFFGKRFVEPPEEPVVVKIRPENEDGELLPMFGPATLMSDELYAAIASAGVDNLEVFKAEIRSKDGAIVHRGYKAFNIVGLVKAADIKDTVFSEEPASRLIDASIESLALDPQTAQGLLMFRLAEYVGAIVVHRRVKEAIENRRFKGMVFRHPEEFVS
jgi:hypothetical protein